MTVKAILSRKGSDVVTIAPTAPLVDAVKLLAERRIGAIIITGPGDRVAGILSERDIVRALADRGHAALDDQVGALMTRKVVTCGCGDTIAAIMERMTEGKFRHLPVVENGTPLTVISIRDLLAEAVQHHARVIGELERERMTMFTSTA